MAINPNSAFPTRTSAPSAGYPYGGAQNVTTPNDGTGTPWIASLINDVFGFQQALLTAAGIVPSGAPDQVGASQYLDAVNALIAAGGGGGNEFPGPDPTLVDSVAAIIIGTDDPDLNPHIAMGPNVIQAKVDSGSVGSLHLQRYGGGTFIWQSETTMKAMFQPSTIHLFGQEGSGPNAQNVIFFEGDNFSSGNSHLGFIGDPVEFVIRNGRDGPIRLFTNEFNGRTEVKPSLRGEANYSGFLTPMMNLESTEIASLTSLRHALQIGNPSTNLRLGGGVICTNGTGFGNFLKLQPENNQITRIGSANAGQYYLQIDNSSGASVHSADGFFNLSSLITAPPGTGNFLANGTVPMTGTLEINAPAGDIINAGNLIVVSGAGGIGLHYGQPGSYGAGLEIFPSGDISLRSGTGATAKVTCSGSVVTLRRSSSEISAQNITAATGGLQVNNQLTGAGLERVLTVSDLTAVALRKRITTTVDAPSTTPVTIASLSFTVAAGKTLRLAGTIKLLAELTDCVLTVDVTAGAELNGTMTHVTPAGVVMGKQVGGASSALTVPLHATDISSVTLDVLVHGTTGTQTVSFTIAQAVVNATPVRALINSAFTVTDMG